MADNIAQKVFVLLKKEIDRLNPPNKHDHDYFHTNCGLCRMEEDVYNKATGKVLQEAEDIIRTNNG